MKKIIYVVIAVALILVVGGGLFFFLKGQSGGSATTQGLPSDGSSSTTSISSNPTAMSQATLVLGDASIPGANISSQLPSDSPSGVTISFQTANGTVAVKNFYSGAQGYWLDLDALLLQYNQAYTLWYYRSNSGFVIVLPEDGENQAAAESALASDLGVSSQMLCSLPVTVEQLLDNGNSNEELPLESCP
jgi:hypothetical protein